MQHAAGDATDLLKALANRNRLMLLCQLTGGEKSVGELADLLEIRDTSVSQQLALLRKDGLVAARRDAQTIYYRLASDEAAKILETLYTIFCADVCAPAKGRKRKAA
ncbi:MAG: metalloregulator ArsR/SmtB family transcription factor [Pseudolabrys sp.]